MNQDLQLRIETEATKKDTSESSDVVNAQVSPNDLASQSKSDLQTSGSENIASESNWSNSHPS
jgi:midasin